MHKHLSKLIKTYQFKNNIKSLDMADKLGFTPQFYSHISNGKVGLPIKYIPKLAKLLNIPDTQIRDVIYLDMQDKFNKKLNRLKWEK